jgi:hypothetical protein
MLRRRRRRRRAAQQGLWLLQSLQS